jgi:hypothetical protein
MKVLYNINIFIFIGGIMNKKKLIYSSLLGLIYLFTIGFAINGMINGESLDQLLDTILIVVSSLSILFLVFYVLTKNKFNWLYIASYIPITAIHFLLAIAISVLIGFNHGISYIFPLTTIALVVLLVLSYKENKTSKIQTI